MDMVNPHTLSPNQALLEFENVTVFCGTKKVLDSLSITVREGENIAILGPNGAGKSSFIRTILRELYPVPDNTQVIFRMGRTYGTYLRFALQSVSCQMTCSTRLPAL
jgi:iron complex transport system ATP-binding protein